MPLHLANTIESLASAQAGDKKTFMETNRAYMQALTQHCKEILRRRETVGDMDLDQEIRLRNLIHDMIYQGGSD